MTERMSEDLFAFLRWRRTSQQPLLTSDIIRRWGYSSLAVRMPITPASQFCPLSIGSYSIRIVVYF